MGQTLRDGRKQPFSDQREAPDAIQHLTPIRSQEAARHHLLALDHEADPHPASQAGIVATSYC
jgi:hypothetical protein